MKAIKFLTIALALTAMQTVQAADNLNGKNNGTTIVQPTTEYYYVGDLNDDGKVNTLDLTLLQRYVNKWDGAENNVKNDLAADVNNDGKVNSLDLTILKRAVNKWEGYEQYLIQREKPTLH